MRTTNEVMQAVKDGTECTDEELRYAVHNMALWHSQYMFDIARAITEDPVTPKTKRGLQRAWDSWRERNSVPLDKWLKGSSYEPGVPKEVLHERWLDKTSETAGKFVDALTALSEAYQKPNK